MQINIINAEDEKTSKEGLTAFYQEGLIPAEKKNYLTRLKASVGPWMGLEGADGKPKFLLDAASQIATLGLGLNSAPFMGTAHILESWLNNTDSDDFKRIDRSFCELIQRQIGWNKPGDRVHLTYVNSGAEANETALGACFENRSNPAARKVLAFEGSFHGRMMVTLAATWNKQKREPFEWPGYEVAYCPFPELGGSEIHLPMPANWRQAWSEASALDFTPSFDTKDQDLQAETACLMKVREQLLTGQIYAIIAEPMQCEGGDRFGSDRFFTGLLAMAKCFGVEVVIDEVQTGFHLGRHFFWHKQFQLTDHHGAELRPQYVVCAKKAQVGMVVSGRPLPAKPEFQVASLVRGYIHAVALTQSHEKIMELERTADKRLEKLTAAYPEFIHKPRALGLSFAFDFKDAAHCNAFVAKRFERGLMYYPAGDKTLRFRLNTAFNESELDFLFSQLAHLCDEVFHQKKHASPEYHTTMDRGVEELYEWHEMLLDLQVQTLMGQKIGIDGIMAKVTKLMNLEEEGAKLVLVTPQNFGKYRKQIQDLQQRIYEPVRRTSDELFELTVNDPHGLCLVIESEEGLAAIAFSSPLKNYPLESALRADPYFQNPKVLYMLDVTVDHNFHKKGLGRNLKYAVACLGLARGVERINGKNREQLARQMININLSLGSYELFHRTEHYQDLSPGRDLFYYTTPIAWKTPRLNLSGSIHMPLGTRSLTRPYLVEQLPYMNNKVCLSNFVSKRFLGHIRDIMHQLPAELRSGFSASGQSECTDKAAKTIWSMGRKKTTLLTFEGHYFGQGSNLSRSLSDPRHDYFPVDRLPHPNEKNQAEVLKGLEQALATESHLALFLEPLPQKLMREVPRGFLEKALALAKKHDVPVVYNETASSKFHYSSEAYFVASLPGLTPDVVMCFLGGQAGIVATVKKHYMDKPLMMISTWDGDELSFAHYHASMQQVLKQKEKYLKTKQLFQEKLGAETRKFAGVKAEITNGRGIIQGPLPEKWASLFTRQGANFIVHPSFDAMEEYLEQK